MKNKIIFLILIFFYQPLLAENLNIQSSSIDIDKNLKLTIFKDNVIVEDSKKNILKTNYAEYNKELKLLISKGKTTLLTSEGFFLTSDNIIFDDAKKYIKSDNPTVIEDIEKNKIFLEKFEYSINDNFFKSTGKIKVEDSNKNSYNFSQIYIDEKKKEIVGTDIKAFLNQEDFKINEKNKPRVFANTIKINKNESQFSKSIFTLCDYRKNDKCPPWSLQAGQMSHDKKKKTIYYDNAVLKIYDIPIFYFPKISHPDPTVDRRSGFLPPSFSDTKNLGAGFEVPYFWAIKKDRDLTFTSKIFTSEHPLFLGEYRHVFEKSNLILDFGHSKGYKNTTQTKSAGSKSHFFSQFIKNFKGKNGSDNNLKLSVQNVSNNKYLKLYKIKTNLADYETDNLENTLNFTHENNDLFLGFTASAFETLKDSYNDKYEYVLPDLLIDKNLFSNNKYGIADFRTNLKIHNYDTNKFTKFIVNDIDWKIKNLNFDSGLNGEILANFKNVNYETKNVNQYKKDPTSEFFGALGYLTEIDLFKTTNDNFDHFFTPKMLFRYAPGHMRKEDSNMRLTYLNAFDLDRLSSYNNFESGLSTTLGFDYKIKSKNKEINFAAAQVIREKENLNMPSSSSLDQRFSDVVGENNFKINDNFELNYNYALDQNYKNLNYNEIEAKFTFNPIKFDLNYLQEKEHIGDQEYFKASLEYNKNDNSLFSVETKRNLITNSAEYYNLSYEYLNDCLKAGLVYRREFYNDSELEPENSLMFKVTLIPFGDINSPSFSN